MSDNPINDFNRNQGVQAAARRARRKTMNDIQKLIEYRNSRGFLFRDLWETFLLGSAILLVGSILYRGGVSAVMWHAGMSIW